MEYSMIVVLVMLALIIAGPYVIRAVNGMIHSWEDGAKDSLREEMYD